jgi:hypothetical protein
MGFPVRTTQLVERDPEESVFRYRKRIWEAEFHDALSKIEDTPTRNALFALKNLT